MKLPASSTLLGLAMVAAFPIKIITGDHLDDYVLVGCYGDSRSLRIMFDKQSEPIMSAQICYDLCNDGTNTHFGTQYGRECWCGIHPALATHGELDIDSCDMACQGTEGENCGGFDKMTVYDIQAVNGGTGTDYQGCFRDALPRAMPGNPLVFDAMTNKLCVDHCASFGYAWAATEYGQECFCGNNEEPFTYGEIDEGECDFTCPGGSAAPDENCGGWWALSVYSAYPTQL
ncbi:unnamed protein product [Ectocarpus sp. 6 AP-2014]